MSTLKTNTIQAATGTTVNIASGQVLNAPGHVLQTISTKKTDTVASSSTSLIDITGMSVTITPSSTSSKILILVNCSITGSNSGCGISLLRGSTEVHLGDASGSMYRHSMLGMYGNSSPNTYNGGPNCIIFLDSPNTTSATTYKLQGRVLSGGEFYIGRTHYNTDNGNAGRFPSTITVQEIAQ